MANPRNNHYTYCREELPDLSYVYQFITSDKLGLLNKKGVVPYYLGYLAFRNNELLDQLHTEFEQIALRFAGFRMAK